MKRVLLLMLIAAPVRSATVTPSLALSQGWNDNVNARPDDTGVAAVQERDAFVLLSPGARVAQRVGERLSVGGSYRAELERYDKSPEGNSWGQSLAADARLASEGPSLAVSGAYLLRASPELVDGAGRAFLNNQAVKGGGTLEIPFTGDKSLGMSLGGSYLSRRYPDYRVVTDATAPGAQKPRAETTGAGQVGLSYQPVRWARGQAMFSYGRNRANALMPQGPDGTYLDFFSYRTNGVTGAATLAPLRRLRLDVSGQVQRRFPDAKLIAGSAVKEQTTVLAGGLTASWLLSRTVSVSADEQYLQFKSNDSRASFHENRVSIGVRVAEDWVF